MNEPTASDRLGGKPWIAWTAAFLAFINVTIGAYMVATLLPGLPVDALVAAGGFITAGSIAYGYSASRVKVKELEAEVALSDDA